MNARGQEDLQRVLLAWMNNSKRAQIGHYECETKYARLNLYIGIPVVALSAIVGTSVFASIETQVSVPAQITIGMISVLAAVLASLQTFLRFNERATMHHFAGSDYESLKRQIQTMLATEDLESSDALYKVSRIREQMDTISKNAPSIPTKIFKSACEKVPFAEKSLSIERILEQKGARRKESIGDVVE